MLVESLAPETQGTPAFVPPANFAEFLEMEPLFCRRFLRSKRCDPRTLADDEQSLFAFLLRPTKGMKAKGQCDRLATFKPELRGGKEIRDMHAAWGDYMTLILGREWGKIIKRRQKSCVEGPNVLSLSGDDFDIPKSSSIKMRSENNSLGLSLGMVQDLQDAFTTQSHTEVMTTKHFVGKFIQFVNDENPYLAYVALTIAHSSTEVEAKKFMGLSDSTYQTAKRDLQALGRIFSKRLRRRALR